MKWLQKIRKNKKITILILCGLVIIGLAAWWGWSAYQDDQKTYPLGDNSRIEYIGKKDYGCHGICGSAPGTTFFYGTNLTPPELVRYFTNARTTRPGEVLDWKKPVGDKISLGFYDNDNQYFGMTFYFQGPAKAASFNLKTEKNFLFTLDSKFYQTAKNSL